MIFTLIGMTGSGKTTVGRIAAGICGCRFLDTDEIIGIERIKAVFENGGEEAFRKLEYSTLKNVISNSGDGEAIILSCGGGIVMYEKSRELLKERTIPIWIKRDISLSVKENAVNRPPFCGDAEKFKELYEIRRPIYSSTAKFTTENNESINEAAKKLADIILSLKGAF